MPVEIELGNPKEDYPSSRVIKQDADGNVIVEKVAEEDNNVRIVYDSDGNKHILGRDEHISSQERKFEENDAVRLDCRYCDNQNCNHDASGNYRHNYHSELEYDEEYDKEIGHEETDMNNDLRDTKLQFSRKLQEMNEFHDDQETDFGSDDEQNQRCTCNLPHYHDYADNETNIKAISRSKKKKTDFSPSTLLEKQKNIIYEQIQRPVIGNFLWDFEYPEDIPEMTEFWLQLPYERKREVADMDFAEVLRLVHVDIKSTCTCALCGHRKALVEKELEKLYNGYYNVRRLAVRYLDSVDLNINTINSILGIIEEERTEDEVIEPTDDQDLSVNGLLSVADDLVKNNGENFISLIEKLDNDDSRRIESPNGDDRQFTQKENFSKAIEFASSQRNVNDDADLERSQNERWDQADDDVDDEEDIDNDSDQENYSDTSNNSESSNNDYTSEKRLEETYKMLQICASKILRKRLHDAFQAKRAEDISRSLLDEAEKEMKLKKEKEEKERAKKEKAKEKKRLLKLAKEEEQRKLEEERKEKERLLREEQLRKTEEGRKKKEAERKKREEELKMKQEEKKKRKLLEMERQKKEREEREKKKAELRQIREAEMKAKKEEKERRERERKARQEEKQRQRDQEEEDRRIALEAEQKKQDMKEESVTLNDSNVKHILKRDPSGTTTSEPGLPVTAPNLVGVPTLDNHSLNAQDISNQNLSGFSSGLVGLDLRETNPQLPNAGIFDSILFNDPVNSNSMNSIQPRSQSIWDSGNPGIAENGYMGPNAIDNRHNSIWSPANDVKINLNQPNWNNSNTTDNIVPNLSLGVGSQFNQFHTEMTTSRDEELIQREVLKAIQHLPRVSENTFSVALLYHYTKGVLNSILPNFSMQKFTDSLSVNLEVKLNAKFNIRRDENNEENVEILFRAPSNTNIGFDTTPFSNMHHSNLNFNNLSNPKLVHGEYSPYNNLNTNLNTNLGTNMNMNVNMNINSNIHPNMNPNPNVNPTISPIMNSNMMNTSMNMGANASTNLLDNLSAGLSNYNEFNTPSYMETSTFNGPNGAELYDMNQQIRLLNSLNGFNGDMKNTPQLNEMANFGLNSIEKPTLNNNMDANMGFTSNYLGGLPMSMNNLNLNTGVIGSNSYENLTMNSTTNRQDRFKSSQGELHTVQSSPEKEH